MNPASFLPSLPRRAFLSLSLALGLTATHPGLSFVRGQEPAAPAPAPAEPAPAPAPLFPDPGLEAAVRAEVYAKRYNQEPLTADDVKNISRVIGRGKAIKSLAGMENCPAVMLIDLANNEIQDLTPIAKLTRLQSVTLAGNQIKDIAPLKELTAIQLLDLSRNQVTDLTPLTEMKNLRTLYVAANGLESLDPIAGLTKIWSLDASENKLTKLDAVGALAWLTMLDVRENGVETLAPLAPLKELDFLLLTGNKIADLAPLVEMCKADAAGEKRFAPYLRLYVGENPLSDQAKGEQLEAIKAAGVKIFLE